MNTKSGSKLLLNDIIPIQNGLLQLTHDNTQFQYGSNTYPRPRSSYRVCTKFKRKFNDDFSCRQTVEVAHIERHMKVDVSEYFFFENFLFFLRIGNSRYDNDGGENNFLKRPPPKNTLMDFMTSLNISNDNEHEKSKERFDNNNNKRQSNGNNDQILFQQDVIDEPLDSEDDPAHANYRERRNPLPPR